MSDNFTVKRLQLNVETQELGAACQSGSDPCPHRR